MFLRNCLRAGDFLTVVPVGINVTLQYNDKGTLEKVYRGYSDAEKINVSDKLLKPLLDAATAPIKIPLRGGTTWIRGVLYTDKLFYDEGLLPDAIYDSITSEYIKHPETFKFYAGNAESLATIFRGAVNIRQWLSMNKFNVLPGWIVSSNMNKANFWNLIHSKEYPFKSPLVSHYMIYRGADVLYQSTGLYQFTAGRVTKQLLDDGSIKANVFRNGSIFKSFNYSDIVRHNVLPNTLIVLDEYEEIVYTTPTDDKKRDKRSSTIECSHCGKIIQVPEIGKVTCADPHCTSRLYKGMCRFLTILGLPDISYDRYIEAVGDQKITCIPDVLQLPEYVNHNIEIKLADLLKSIVPSEIVTDESIFSSFVNRCNNNTKTFLHYIKHPDQIVDDLELHTSPVRFIHWLSDPCNVLDIEALLDSPQIVITMTNKKFEGAPIFRDKIILITGKFRHGLTSDIISILESYDAKVVTSLQPVVHCVIVGDILEDINSVMIRSAQNRNIPIYQEGSFFQAYGIDDDLKANL